MSDLAEVALTDGVVGQPHRTQARAFARFCEHVDAYTDVAVPLGDPRELRLCCYYVPRTSPSWACGRFSRGARLEQTNEIDEDGLEIPRAMLHPGTRDHDDS